jgi:DNA mismatch endonuclease (patch repair protein)
MSGTEGAMPDIMTKEERSERMSRVKGKDSKPEKRVRSFLHRLGFRFRLHVAGLPGKPDIVLPRHRKIILVHGCYWHRHGVCRRLSIPENKPDFWRKKFAGNVERDRRNILELKNLGWDVLVIWECQTKDEETLKAIVTRFLGVVDR